MCFCVAPGTREIGSAGAAVGVGGASSAPAPLGTQSQPRAVADGAHLAAAGRTLWTAASGRAAAERLFFPALGSRPRTPCSLQVSP